MGTYRMATRRHTFLEASIGDGLTDYAVWADNDRANGRIVVRKIEKYDSSKPYSNGVSGIVRAKDELDVYRLIERYNPWKS